MKSFIWIGATIGSIAGGWLGSLLGGGMLGWQGILGGMIGGIGGIYLGYKANQRIGE